MTTHDDDTDPTGMRALLRGLPDPGPMPEDLVARIHATLADLPPLDLSGDDDVSRGTLPVAVPTSTPRSVPDDEPGVRALPATTAVRPSWWSRHAGHAAVAAVVLIGGGAALTGNLGLGGSSSDSGTSSAVSDSAGSQAESYAKPQGAKGGTDDSDSDRMAGSAALGPVRVHHSGQAYTSAGLAAEVAGATPGPTIPPLTAESPAIGPIGTEVGVRSCLEALGLPSGSAADVDLGTLDGEDVAIVVVTLGGERTAYAVGRNCTTGNAALRTGPIPLP
ncbi:hypothetical protein [Knoellia subterranea]|uniref:Uncharacterized protein n=1 Tax=Knoellia subterranea KCTC 19937 TaxID=1385521 RepID=A0A0A0JNG5_9MICO|nr:hypothetical protein [Knoellia subterranea]KGN37572.1 hypothetical protein N803_13580 [Knoellia subterranea KCTC 19937]